MKVLTRSHKLELFEVEDYVNKYVLSSSRNELINISTASISNPGSLHSEQYIVWYTVNAMPSGQM